MLHINTNRLVIRTFMDKDAVGLWEYLAQPRANCFLDERLGSLEAAALEVARRKKQEGRLAVCLKNNDRIIGDVFAVMEEPDTYNVGWHINRKYEGKGYACEAAMAYLNFLFLARGARRVYGYVEETNTRSQRLCERLGMRREGCFVEFISFVKHPDGTPKYENTLVYAILKKEWDAMSTSEFTQ